MNNEHLDHFGRILIKNVRDEAIEHWDKILMGKMKGQESQKIHQNIINDFNKEQIELLQNLLPQVVDTTLHYLLWTIEQDESIKVSIGLDQGPPLEHISDGLPGELYSEDGWICRFSGREPRS